MQGEIVVQYHQEPLSGHTMLWFYTGSLIRCYIGLCIIIWVCAGFAYRANAKLPADDSTKKAFRPSAIVLAPFTLPILVIGTLSLFVLRAILYSLFLVVITIFLVVFRKPKSPTWLEKLVTKIGNILLEANTWLIEIILGPWIRNPQPS
jgi:hypothetical protein